ncbi:MFS transporter [Microbacterium sp. ASV49]|uniref:MFS transporter n=1 Tax=Microbacterium candidum TaxID=3041922 RepID=A0ABT7MWJ9_9MICO|nr:MFS transporter [Microbacterium sp. ASV49]MDL9978832.1 MFS transporter [Microbacterium sp. ASV49]
MTEKEPGLIRATGFAYFPIALIARFPYAMMVVGVLTLVVAGRGSLALGGVNSAMVGLGAAICGPLIGAAADRFGQRPVVLATGIANSLVLVALAWVVFSPLPAAAILVTSLLVGATAPQVSPMSRSRLVGIIDRAFPRARRPRILNATMAYESAADEIVFVFGPVVVGVLATAFTPAAPIIGAAVLTAVFVTAFALHPSGRTLRAAEPGVPLVTADLVVQAPARELFGVRLMTVTVGTLGMGLFFGSMLTSLTAFMRDRGAETEAGLVYGAMGVGSAIFALGVMFFPARFSLRARWLTFSGVIFVGSLSLPFVGDVGHMALALLVIGIGIGPTLVTQYSLGAAYSPAGRSATVMTIIGSSVIVGQSAAAALTGAIAQSAGTATALYIPIVSAAVVVIAGIVNAALGSRH